jgi:hypothetical protein
MHLRSRLLAAACEGFVCAVCIGQSAPTFTTETSVSGPAPSHIYAVDVNNDGLTDVIMDTAQPATTGSYFAVSINNGDGTFQPPVNYPVNSPDRPLLTWGDFNNDGEVDIALVLPQTSQVAVYLGNGDGTFQSPITTTVALPSGMNFYGVVSQDSIVAADFNKDGNIDLVAAVNDGDEFGGTWAVYLLQGDGTGHFTNPTDIYDPTSGWTVQRLVGGDFDTDDNADVGVLEEMTCSSGSGYCWSNVLSLFGDGAGNFQPVDVTYTTGTMTLGAADLNNDGATDLYGIQYGTSGSEQLAVFPGHYDRAFSYYYTPIPSSIASTGVGVLSAVADFNGTGNWALAGLWAAPSGSSTPDYQMIYFLNAGIENDVQIVTGPSPASGEGWQVGPVVGNFNGDLKPDIAVVGSPAVNSSGSTLAAGINANAQGYYGFCNYPSSGQGISVCGPTSAGGGETNISAAANSFGQLRKIELWVDGVKVGEYHLVWGQSAYFNLSFPTPPSGTHYATFYAADIDNRLQRYDFTFTTP